MEAYNDRLGSIQALLDRKEFLRGVSRGVEHGCFYEDARAIYGDVEWLVSEVRRLQEALRQVEREAGSHTVALQGTPTGFRRIFDITQDALADA